MACARGCPGDFHSGFTGGPIILGSVLRIWECFRLKMGVSLAQMRGTHNSGLCFTHLGMFSFENGSFPRKNEGLRFKTEKKTFSLGVL